MVRQISVYIDDWQYDELQKKENKSLAVRAALELYFKNNKEEKEMKLIEIASEAEKEGYDFIQDNAGPITAIFNYDFGAGDDGRDYVLTNCDNEKGQIWEVENNYLKQKWFDVYTEKYYMNKEVN